MGPIAREWAIVLGLPRPQRMRLAACVGYLVLLTLLFIQPLTRLEQYAAQSEMFSYILLVPFISAYMLFVQRWRCPAVFFGSMGGTVAAGGIGIGGAGCGHRVAGEPEP